MSTNGAESGGGGLTDARLKRINELMALAYGEEPPAARIEELEPSLVTESDGSAYSRARAYIAAIPGAVSGAGGHHQTFVVACHLRRGFGLSESDARQLMNEYNATCDPPWSSRELEHKLADAAEANLPLGYLLKGGPEIAKKQATVNSISANAEMMPAATAAYNSVQFSEISDEDASAWLVDSLWGLEAVGIIGGEPKTYKSFFTAAVAIAVAAGNKLFGRLDVKQGPVLMFNAEDRPAMTKRRLTEMCNANELEIQKVPLFVLTKPRLSLDSDADMALLRTEIERRKPVLVILDPLRNLHGGDENDAQTINRLLSPLREIQREFHTAIMLVHHMAKFSEVSSQRRPGQRLRGSSALHGWVDSSVYLELASADSKVVTVRAEHRSAESPDKFSFEIKNAECPAGKALWLDYKPVGEGNAAKAPSTPENVEPMILAALKASQLPLSAKRIRDAVPCRVTIADAAIRSLAQTSQIELVDFEMELKDGRKKEAKGWRIKQ